MEQLRLQNVQKTNLNIILGTVNALAELEKRKRKDNIVKDIKSLFRLKKEIRNKEYF